MKNIIKIMLISSFFVLGASSAYADDDFKEFQQEMLDDAKKDNRSAEYVDCIKKSTNEDSLMICEESFES